MHSQTVIINPGLARCGTTASNMFFQALPGFSTPANVKELKFFFNPGDLSAYRACFHPPGQSILFESSPPYMHGGLERFQTVIGRISDLFAGNMNIYLMVNLRNLFKRAFSHYWHDINKHYAVFGKYWKVQTRSDPRRFKTLYRQGFIEALSSPRNDQKFLPPIGEMLRAAIAAFGSARVRIAHTPNLNTSLQAFVETVSDKPARPGLVPPRRPGAVAPFYLHGGQTGETAWIDTPDGPQALPIPPRSCLLCTGNHTEILWAEDYDLDALMEAASEWTREVSVENLPTRVFEYIDKQRKLITDLPDECFLAGLKSDALEELFRLPKTLKMKPARPVADHALIEILNGGA